MKNISLSEKNVLILTQEGDCPNAAEYVYTRLHHPLILSTCILNVEVKKQRKNMSLDYNNLDLIIIPEAGFPYLNKNFIKQIIEYLDAGGSIFFVQPMSSPKIFNNKLGEYLGLKFRNWEAASVDYSIVTDHPLTGILGISQGRCIYPHRSYWGHLKILPEDARSVTLLGSHGDPDIIISNKLKATIVATDIFHDLLRFYRHPEFDSYNDNLSTLFVNIVLHLLNLEPSYYVLPDAVQKLAPLFYAYGLGKRFVQQINQGSLNNLDQAENLINSGANKLLKSNVIKAKIDIVSALNELAKLAREQRNVKPYFVRGWHGGIIFDDYQTNGLIGYAEWGWPEFTLKWLRRQLVFIEDYNARRLNEIPAQTWDIISKYYPEEISLFRKATKECKLESVKGMYSDSYLEILGCESNIRQFFYGTKSLEDRLGTQVETYLCAYDDFAFHPQLPQILKQFDFKFAVLRCGGPGEIKKLDDEIIYWQGLDSTEILSVPTYRKPEIPYLCSQDIISATKRIIKEADEKGFNTIVIGGSQDTTMDYPFEKEHTILNSLATVHGEIVTYKDYFKGVEKPKTSYYLGVDDLFGKPHFWSGYGSINEFAIKDRQIETQLVNAEKMSAIASLFGYKYPEENFDRAWRNLLTTQDHFTYGCGGECNPEGYHVGGLYEPGVANYPGPKNPITCYKKTIEIRDEAEAISKIALNNACQFIADKIKTVENLPEDGVLPVIIFNTLNWSRKSIGCIDIMLKGGQNNLSIGNIGNESINYVKKLYFPVDLKAMGYQVYWIRKSDIELVQNQKEEDKSVTTIESKFYKIDFDRDKGCISKIYDNELDETILKEKNGISPNEIVYEFKGKRSSSRDNLSTIKLLERNSLFSRVEMKGNINGYNFSNYVTLYNNIKRIDFELNIDYAEGAIFGHKMEEKTNLRVVFPFTYKGKYYLNQPFGVYPTNKEVQVAQDFVELRGENITIALIQNGIPGYLMECSSISLILADGFPPLRGMHTYSYSLFSRSSRSSVAKTLQAAKEFQNPPLFVLNNSHTGEFPTAGQLISISSDPEVFLSALYSDNKKVFARFYNLSGGYKTLKFNSLIPIKKVAHTNLRGNRIKELKCVMGMLKDELSPWEIKTYSLDFIDS